MNLTGMTTHVASPSNSILRYICFACLIASQCMFAVFSQAEEGSIDSNAVLNQETDLTAKQVELTTDDVAYLTQLGLLRGHLLVGFELYERALPDMSETHMKHPNAELYADLIPAFASRGCEGFADELSELARVVSARKSIEVVTSRYEQLSVAIHGCETVAEQENRIVVVKVALNLLANALLEYEIGVVDGVIHNVHEFQDAWGFTQVASRYVQLPIFQADNEGQLTARRIGRLIASLDPLWPTLNPTRIDNPIVPSLLQRMRAYTDSAAE